MILTDPRDKVAPIKCNKTSKYEVLASYQLQELVNNNISNYVHSIKAMIICKGFFPFYQ